MEQQDRVYFAKRAAEEQELATGAQNDAAAAVHRKLQRAYLERALIGDRVPGSQQAG